MKTYSPYFKTLHDEQGPTGTLGRGTHYSILRAVVFHDSKGKALSQACFLDFAIVWDEDHDDRVIEPIERMYFAGLLPRFTMFGERKGMFTAILAESADDASLKGRVNEISNALANGDSWHAETVRLPQSRNPIISDSDEKVELYLSNLLMLWELGLKKVESPMVFPPLSPISLDASSRPK